jgi:hypothetical protein
VTVSELIALLQNIPGHLPVELDEEAGVDHTRPQVLVGDEAVSIIGTMLD